jgi:hypothetical protein
VAPELAAQLEVLALRGGERGLQVLGLGAVALLDRSDLGVATSGRVGIAW